MDICWKWMQLTNLQENKYRTLNNGKVQVHCHETHKCLSKTLSRQSKTLVKGETHKMFSCCHCQDNPHYYLDNRHHSHDHGARWSSVKIIIIAIENYPQAFAAVGDDPSISTSRQVPPSSQQVKVVDSHGHQGEHCFFLCTSLHNSFLKFCLSCLRCWRSSMLPTTLAHRPW